MEMLEIFGSERDIFSLILIVVAIVTIWLLIRQVFFVLNPHKRRDHSDRDRR